MKSDDDLSRKEQARRADRGWIVEIRKMTGGVSKTIRQRTRDYSEAKRLEASLRGSAGRPARLPVAVQAPSFTTRLPAPVQASNIGSGSDSEIGFHGIDLTDMSVPPKIFTLRDLYDGARSIYKGSKDEKQSCERLYAALQILGWDMDLQELRTAALDYLVDVLRSRGLNPKTINRYLYAVSGALRWAHSRELIPGMPIIPRQTEGVGRIAFLTEEDQQRVIQWLTDHGFSDVAFATRTLLLTGFRISEFLGLARGDIRDGWVTLHEGTTKNDQGRTVFVGDLSTALIARVSSGLPSYQRIAKGLSLASDALSIKPKVTPHVLRHSCATMLTTKGTPLSTVGKLLGHRSLGRVVI
jgi:integrase